MMLIECMHAFLVSEGIVKVHGAAACDREVLGDTVFNKCFRYVLR